MNRGSYDKRDSFKKNDKNKKRKPRRKKICRVCSNPEMNINYKDAKTLSYFISDKGKIVSRRISGICSKHQRELGRAIKRARNIALVPYVTNLP